jgi:transcriptional regulator with XRE-family HTH domain
LCAMVTRIRKGARAHLYITEWMDHFGVSDDQMAGRLETTRQTIWRWKKEPWRLDPGKIAALAEALDIDPRDFYRLPHSRESLDQITETLPDDLYEMLLNQARLLSKRAS